MEPRVSGVLTTYNGASRGYLVEASESVLKQSYPDYELLIVDEVQMTTRENSAVHSWVIPGYDTCIRPTRVWHVLAIPEYKLPTASLSAS